MNPEVKRVFIYATLAEAQPLIDQLAAASVEEGVHRFATRHHGQALRIVVCGMGVSAAARATTAVIQQYPKATITNCGIAGSLSDELSVGDILNVRYSRMLKDSQLDDRQQEISRSDQHLGDYRDAVLLTVDVPVFDPVHRQALAHVAQLVDMEGAAIARICHQQNIPCQLLKAVSDFALTREQLHRNLQSVSATLARKVAASLELCHTQPSSLQVAL